LHSGPLAEEEGKYGIDDLDGRQPQLIRYSPPSVARAVAWLLSKTSVLT